MNIVVTCGMAIDFHRFPCYIVYNIYNSFVLHVCMHTLMFPSLLNFRIVLFMFQCFQLILFSKEESIKITIIVPD